MTSRVELDLPPADCSLPLRDLERFVEQARYAGAEADTPVIAVAAEQDPDMTVALRIEFDGVPAERAELHDLLSLVDEIERNNGTQRFSIAPSANCQRLTKHPL